MAKILIVDDHLPFRAVFAETITSFKHDVIEAGTGDEALEILAGAAPDMIFLDLRLPDQNGIDVLKQIKNVDSTKHIPVAILTAYADSANTISAMKLGAFDHLTKPISRETLRETLAKALGGTIQNGQLDTKPAEIESHAEEEKIDNLLVGASPAFREVEKLIGLVASIKSNVLLVGETGTGKNLIARLIHANSEQRAELTEHSLLEISCANATQALSKWRSARTIFLDEIGDLDTTAQLTILELLSEQNEIPRVISSTSFDSTQLIQERHIREELYYRLSAFPIFIPPLRARNSDTLVLAESFIARTCTEMPKRLTPSASKALLEYHWPGNVRELKNVITRASVISRGPNIDVQDLSFPPSQAQTENNLSNLLELDYYGAVARLEKALLEKALEHSGGNRTEAARTLGINRQLLYSKLKEHGIE